MPSLPQSNSQGFQSPSSKGKGSATCYTTFTHTSLWGSWGTKNTAGAGRSAHWANFHLSSAVLPNWGSSTWLEVSECATQLQESKTSVLGKVMEQFIPSTITWHIQDSQVIRATNTSLGKVGPAWPTWSQSMTRYPTQWMRVGSGCCLLGLYKVFRYCFSQYLLGGTGSWWLGRAFSLLSWGQVCEVQQGQMPGRHLGRLGEGLKSCPSEKDPGVLVDSDWIWASRVSMWPRRPTTTWPESELVWP